jgi:tellurite resistance protein TerC
LPVAGVAPATATTLNVTPLAWAGAFALVAALLYLDWVVLGRRGGSITHRDAVAWSLFYVAAAAAFGLVLSLFAGWDIGVQYLSGYVVEESLSVDNLFVFMILMGAFSVPRELQPRALTVGIVLALALRAALIALGAALLSAFSFMLVVFGLALLITAIQLVRHRDRDPAVDDNALVRLARRLLPVASTYEQGRVLTRANGKLAVTPLLLVLLAIGSADVIFAFDSIPAVFGVTRHVYIVFVANAFALLGLRPLFFVISGVLDRLVYMASGLAAILAFIGVKLIAEYAHEQSAAIPQLSTGLALLVIVGVLLVTGVASLAASRRDPSRRARAGSIRGAETDPPEQPRRRPVPGEGRRPGTKMGA